MGYRPGEESKINKKEKQFSYRNLYINNLLIFSKEMCQKSMGIGIRRFKYILFICILLGSLSAAGCGILGSSGENSGEKVYSVDSSQRPSAKERKWNPTPSSQIILRQGDMRIKEVRTTCAEGDYVKTSAVVGNVVNTSGGYVSMLFEDKTGSIQGVLYPETINSDSSIMDTLLKCSERGGSVHVEGVLGVHSNDLEIKILKLEENSPEDAQAK